MLLSKQAMKDMGMVLNFIDDTAVIEGQKINLSETSSGHYIIPLIPTEQEIHVTLQLTENKEVMMKKIIKLHRQFAHPGKESFIKLLKQSNLYDVNVQACIKVLYIQCFNCGKRICVLVYLCIYVFVFVFVYTNVFSVASCALFGNNIIELILSRPSTLSVSKNNLLADRSLYSWESARPILHCFRGL